MICIFKSLSTVFQFSQACGRVIMLWKVVCQQLAYLFDHKTQFFSFQNNPKALDLSCKTDLDLWDCLGRVPLVL